MELTDKEKQALITSLKSEDKTPQEQQDGLDALRQLSIITLLKNNTTLPESHSLYEALEAARAAQNQPELADVIHLSVVGDDYVSFMGDDFAKAAASACTNDDFQELSPPPKLVALPHEEIVQNQLYGEDVDYHATFEVAVTHDTVELLTTISVDDSAKRQQAFDEHVLMMTCIIEITSAQLEYPWRQEVEVEMEYVAHTRTWEPYKWIKIAIDPTQLDVSKLDGSQCIRISRKRYSKLHFKPIS